MKLLLAVLVLVSCFLCSQASLYGIVTEFSNNDTTTILYTVEIDPSTGDFTYLFQNFVYLGGSMTWNGISGFDQKRDILFWSVNYDSSFIFSADMDTATLRAPMTINSVWIQNYIVDPSADRVYVEAGYLDKSGTREYWYVASLSLDTGASYLMTNLTEAGIESITLSALDYNSGIYYMIASGVWAQFSLSEPTDITTKTLACSNIFQPVWMAFNPNTNSFIGIGEGIKPNIHYSFIHFNITDDEVTCDVKPFQLKEVGIITCFTFDPTVGSLYLGVGTNTGSFLITYNTATGAQTSVAVDYTLADCQVSYTLPKAFTNKITM
eukprot:TRINITY_DN1335_c0_g1_i1.p1 TRINITY_DN1335_c0_g1~~TRINITY_DN1335_c0_g1_i1.p1  ORF type:complete len:323 (+),score=63.56 TRINITY_DN1335_c0_g1_i1:90-1058(+)